MVITEGSLQNLNWHCMEQYKPIVHMAGLYRLQDKQRTKDFSTPIRYVALLLRLQMRTPAWGIHGETTSVTCSWWKLRVKANLTSDH